MNNDQLTIIDMIKKTLIIFAVLIGFTSGQDVWNPTKGPEGGQVRTLMTDSNNNIWAATPLGGLYVSTDNGNSWKQKGNFGSNYDILVDGNTVYVVTTVGLYVSTDYGITWTKNPNAPPGNLRTIYQAGSDFFIGTWGSGIYRSTDDGSTWTQSGLSGLTVEAITYLSGRLYAGTYSDTLFISDDLGNSWSTANNGITSNRVYDLHVVGSDVYCAMSGGLYKSSNSGASWTETGPGTGAIYKVDSDGSYIYTGGTSGKVSRSSNGGLNWSTVNNNGVYSVEALTIAANGTIVTGTLLGIFNSTDFSFSSWNASNSGLTANPIRDMLIYNNYYFTAAEYVGVCRSTDGGQSWARLNLPDQYQYVGFGTGSGSIYTANSGTQVYKSTDLGSTWSLIADLDNQFTYMTGRNDTLIIGTFNGYIHRSYDGGTNWIRIDNGAISGIVRKIDFYDNYIFVKSDGGFYKTGNDGTSWTEITNISANRFAIKNKMIFASRNGGVSRSDDHGASWTDVTTNLPSDNYYTIEASSDKIFVPYYDDDGSKDIYYTSNNGNSWFSLGDPGITTGSIKQSGQIILAGGYYGAVQKAINPERVADSLALVAVYDSLGGDDWNNNGGWKTGAPLDEWFGVILENGRVSELILSGNNLSGQLPEAIGNLGALRHLQMNSNALSGTLPKNDTRQAPDPSQPEYGESFIETEGNNKLIGKIPGAIGNLTKLEELYLQYNYDLGGAIPPEFGNLVNLRNAYLYSCSFTSIPSTIENCTHLEVFRIYRNQLSDSGIPVEIGNLPNLYYLNLGENLFTVFPQGITNLTNLTYLGLWANQIPSIPDAISDLTNLITLSIGDNPLGGTINPNLGSLNNLENLYISNCGFTEIPAIFYSMASLSRLNIGNNDLTEDDFNDIANIGNLSYLYISNCNLNSLPSVFTSLTTLNGLDISGNGFDNGDIAALTSMTGLAYLNASNNLFNAFPGEILSLSNMSSLYLYSCGIQGNVPAELGNLTNLYDLDLSYNLLSGELPSEIGGLPNLNYLYLDDNDLSGLPEFTTGSLAYLYTRNNKLGFDAIEKNLDNVLYGFYYNPQKNWGDAHTEVGQIGSTYSLTFDIGGDNNTFTWYKDDGVIGGVTGNTNTMTNVQQTENGSYRVEVTNSVVTDMTIISNPVQFYAVNNQLTFRVNMEFQETEGNFDPITNPVYVSGYFNGWGEPGTLMDDSDGDKIYEVTIDVGLIAPGDAVEYKFQYVNSDATLVWEEQVNLDNPPTYNRIFTIETGLPQELDLVFFDNLGYQGDFATDSLALVDLYNNTDGANWIDNTNWLSAEPLETWWGVTVEYGRVTELNLTYNNLAGNLPASIGNLLALNSLDLRSDFWPASSKKPGGQYNKFEELFEEGDQMIIRDKTVDMKKADQYLIGAIPNEIGNLEHLVYLNLSGNQFSGAIPGSISNLTKLETLYLGWCELTSVPSSIGSMPKLLRFSIRNNLMTDTSVPVEIGNLPSLFYLNLIGNQFTSIPSGVYNINTLEILYIYDNQITTIPSNISDLTNLAIFLIGPNPISSPLPSAITTMPNLYTLGLSDIGLTSFPTEINGMTQLYSLWLEYNDIPASNYGGLETLGNLTSLDLGGNDLSTIPSQVKLLTNLERLYLYENLFTTVAQEDLDPLTNLTILDLSSNNLASIPTALLNKTSLERLYLSNNQISGTLPDNISNLVNLYVLDISENYFSGAVPSSISSIAGLAVLMMQKNQFTFLPQLTSLNNLYDLYVYDNQLDFSSIIPNMGAVDPIDGYYWYSPQDSLGEKDQDYIGVGNNYDISTPYTYTGNQYQWYKDGVMIDGATGSTYQLNGVDYPVSGDYTVTMTNTSAPELTLYTQPFTLIVASAPDINNPTVINIGLNTATFSAEVNPGNLSTIVLFRWGTSTSYGNEEQAIGTPIEGTAHVTVTLPVMNLSQGQTYYYQVEALNNFGVTTTGDGPNFTTPTYPSQIDPPAVTFDFPPTKGSKSDYGPNDFQLLSLPGDVNIALTDVFSGTPGEEWTAYHDNGQSSNYLVELNPDNPFYFTAGRGYWVLSMFRDEYAQGPTNSVPLDGEGYFHLPTQNGYNIIGDPFLINVPWAAVQVLNSLTEPLFEFNNTSGSFVTASEMVPNKAYYIRNDNNLNDLVIPFIVNSKMKSPQANLAWKVDIGMRSGTIEESLVSIGIGEAVSQDKDKYDFGRPGQIGYHHGVFLVREEWDEDYPNFATDYREKVEKLEQWDFSVSTPDRKATEISFTGVQDIPELYEVVLVDFQRASSQNLRLETSYHFHPAFDENRFAIWVGHPESIEEEIAKLVPRQFALGKNYPNPFNPETTIPVAIPEDSNVKLVVYNILGQKVKTIFDGQIAQGRHFMKWRGDNEAGNSMPSGTYFYYLVVKGETAKVGKMTLIK